MKSTKLKSIKTKLTGNRLYRCGYNNRYALLAALCTAAIMTVVYFCYDLAPFGNVTILRMDLYHQYGPLFAELYERITNLDSMLYSWKSGGGGGFLGNFYNYLSSPTALIMLLLGHKNMPEAIAGMIFVKSMLASFTFAYFLSKKFNTRTPVVSAFGVLYACSGYFIAYYWNVMWLDAFYLFPLVMLGIEHIINNGRMKLYLIALAATLVTNYYMGYMVCIFSVLYFIYYYFSTYEFTATYFGRLAKRRKGIKGFWRWSVNNLRNSRFFDSGVRFAFASLGAGLVACFSLIPVYFALKNCSATSGTWPQEFKTYFTIFDFLANHLAYLDPTIRSSGTDVLPNVYCGIITVMLVPLYIFSNKISLKEKIFSVSLLGIMFASFYTNYLNYIWHGFHFPNDLPYRFSYMYSFILLVLAFKALLNIREYTNRQIIGVGVATTAFIILVQEIGSKNFSETGVWICVAFIGIYCLALGVLKNDKYPAIAAAALILCSSCAEYTVANTNNYSMDQTKPNFVGDYDNFQKIKEHIDEYEGNDYYRMELTSLRARMDPCWYYYNGMSTFSSMANEKVSNMQSHLGMFSNYINSYTYNRQTPVYNAFFALDYIVDNDTDTKAPMNSELYKEIGAVAKYTAYENLYQLPIAFRVNEEIIEWSHDNANPFEVQSGLFGYSTGINDVYNSMELTSVSGNGTEFNDLSYTEDGYYPYTVSEAMNASVTFELTAKDFGNGYIYLKSSNNDIENITVTLPDGSVVSQHVDTKPHILDLGQLNEGEVVSIYAPFKDAQDGFLYLYGVTLNNESFINGYETLKKDSLNVTKFDETEIEGTINASADGILYTSINYDTGWKVYIDGAEIQADQYHALGNGALLGVDITAGEHTVRFKYTPEGLIVGALISAVSLVMMILICAIIKTGYFKFSPVLYTEELDDESDGDTILEPVDFESFTKDADSEANLNEQEEETEE